MFSSAAGTIGSALSGAMAALGVVDVDEDGELDIDDAEEFLEEKFKLLVGAFIGMFGSDSSHCDSGEEKSTISNSIGAAASKSWNSIKEIGHDFWNEADSRGQKAFNSGYDFANWLGCGVPDIVMETLKSNAERSEKAFDSVYGFSNWISFGNVDMVNETFNPKDPLSKEHWLNSFGTASAIFGIKETKGSVPKKSGVGVPEEFGGINKGAGKASVKTGAYNSNANNAIGNGLGKLADKQLNVSEKGLDIVKNHINQFEEYKPNTEMINRLENAMKNGEKITDADSSFYMHELSESTMMKDLTKTMDFEDAYDIAHGNALEKYGVSPFSVYDIEVIEKYPGEFSPAWKRFWEGNK
ncbi:hypothetical protein NE172_14075 [Clostridium botulinum]|nr:hypothetical protein [Clostridium botulinum]EES50828.1 YD repeat protein [Clostridium botulinum E1 str. 'BoNT E Beluga']MCR1132065.1 hypothetical protein [Clostridium botulinum]